MHPSSLLVHLHHWHTRRLFGFSTWKLCLISAMLQILSHPPTQQKLVHPSSRAMVTVTPPHLHLHSPSKLILPTSTGEHPLVTSDMLGRLTGSNQPALAGVMGGTGLHPPTSGLQVNSSQPRLCCPHSSMHPTGYQLRPPSPALSSGSLPLSKENSFDLGLSYLFWHLQPRVLAPCSLTCM